MGSLAIPGDPWRRASNGLPEPVCPFLPGELPCSGVGSLAAHPVRPGVVFASVYENPFGPWLEERLGMFWTVDGARTWRRFSAQGLPPLSQLRSALVTRDGRLLVAAHRDGGVWVYPLAEALDAPRQVTGRRTAR